MSQWLRTLCSFVNTRVCVFVAVSAALSKAYTISASWRAVCFYNRGYGSDDTGALFWITNVRNAFISVILLTVGVCAACATVTSAGNTTTKTTARPRRLPNGPNPVRHVSWVQVLPLLALHCTTVSAALDPVQNAALMDLYNYCSGASWVNTWTAKLSMDPCTSGWYGVTCNTAKTGVT